VKSQFLYFPDENHWVIKPQNSVLWQKVFFNFLGEQLK
jgi:dipeptidyl aminopeptidase/acylaminoacyl peptidase